MTELRDLLRRTADIAADFLESLDERPVWPPATLAELRGGALGGPLPEEPLRPEQVVTELAEAPDRGIVAEPGGHYFGFVTGGGTGRPRGRLADLGVGPERRALRRRAGGGNGRRTHGRSIPRRDRGPRGRALISSRTAYAEGQALRWLVFRYTRLSNLGSRPAPLLTHQRKEKTHTRGKRD